MPLIVGQEWRRRISRMQWLLNAVLAVECLSMPFFAAGAVAGMVWYGGRRMGADWGWLTGGALAAAGLFLAVWGWLRLRGRFFSRRDTAAFLDEQLGLHAALSAGEEWGHAVAEIAQGKLVFMNFPEAVPPQQPHQCGQCAQAEPHFHDLKTVQ